MTREEASSLLSLFALEHPAEFERWVTIEASSNSVISEIYDTIEHFLRSKCEYASLTDITLGVVELRRAIHEGATKSN